MKKLLIIKNNKISDNEQRTTDQGMDYGLVFSNMSSIIDLPKEIGEVLINNDKITFRAISWCMFPIIWAGDILKIESIEPEKIKIGDILLYKSIGRAYAHRLVKTYKEKGKLYIITTGENEYRDRVVYKDNKGGELASNIIGKVIKVTRGSFVFDPYNVKLSFIKLIRGKLKLFIWNFKQSIIRILSNIFFKLQKIKFYRIVMNNLIRPVVTYHMGIPVISNKNTFNNLYVYKNFNDMVKNIEFKKGIYNISARLFGISIGNIALILKEEKSRKECILSNFKLRIPFRGLGVGFSLVKKAIFLCERFRIDEVNIRVAKEDNIAISIFKKWGFSV